jgi:hypothetical protein
MADVIVKQFVIDTSESEQNLKALDVQLNATTASINSGAAAMNNVASAEENVAVSSKSLKAQLRELQAQLANTAPDSAKYRELSAAAGELKDKVQDAAQAVGTQAGGAFEKVGGSLGLVTSRIANLDFTGAAEGAKLLAKNITDIKPGDITAGIKGIGSALGSVGKALLTNPLFLIGAAIALAVVYSKELLSLIDGVTDADKALLEIQKEKTAQAKQQFDAIGQQEESLKRQGFTEEEILQKKLEALDFAILTAKVTAETTEAQAQGQIDAAKRNKEILEGLLNFVSLPLTALLAGVDLLTEGLNKAGIITDETFAKVGNLRNKFTDSVSNLLFDPAKVEKETKEATEAAKKGVKDLENTRDGLLNARDAKNKAAGDKALAQQQKILDDQLKAEEEYYAQINALADDQFKNSLTKNEQEELAIVQKYETLFATADKAKQDTTQLQQELSAELLALQLKQAADELKIEQEKQRLLAEARIKANAERIAAEDAAFALRQELTLTDQQKEVQAIVTASEAKLIAAGTDTELLKLIADKRESDIAEIVKKYEEKKRQEQLKTFNDQVEWAQKGQQALEGIADAVFANKLAKVKKGSAEEEKLAKQQFKVNKALQLSGAVIDASKAITASLASAPVAIGPIPNPAGIASLALATITGAANVAKIAATKFESSTPPSQTTPSVPEASAAQPAQFNPLAAQFIQNRPDQATPRAFVLAGDVASQQEVRQKVEDLARIG